MKKLAIFVEGQTEQIFVNRLIKEIAGEKRITIVNEKATISGKGNRVFTVIGASSTTPVKEYYFLIRDCGSDSCVKSDIREACESLCKIGYEKILGLQDVYPRQIEDIKKLRQHLMWGMPTKFISINIILAIMEIEAWFLAETNHFTKVHNSLTIEIIKKELSFDPSLQDVESRPHPAEDLHKIYKLVGFAYKKARNQVNRTVSSLNYDNLYLDVRNRVSSLNSFIDHIDTFLT